jgi:hypothetical protein
MARISSSVKIRSSAFAVAFGLVVLVMTSLTFDTTEVFILSANSSVAAGDAWLRSGVSAAVTACLVAVSSLPAGAADRADLACSLVGQTDVSDGAAAAAGAVATLARAVLAAWIGVAAPVAARDAGVAFALTAAAGGVATAACSGSRAPGATAFWAAGLAAFLALLLAISFISASPMLSSRQAGESAIQSSHKAMHACRVSADEGAARTAKPH